MTTPLITIDELKAFMGTSGTQSDQVLVDLLAEGLDAVGDYCGRDFISQQLTKYLNGNDASGLMMSQYPITAVSTLTINGRSIPASFGGGPGYFFEERRINLVGYRFCRGNRNVCITYTGGYGDASGQGGADIAPWPKSLKLAVKMYLTARYRERARIGQLSESMAGQSIHFGDAAAGTSARSEGVPAAAKNILKNFMNKLPV